MSFHGQFDPELERDPLLAVRVRAANALLGQVVDGTDDVVTATWKLQSNRPNEPVIGLTINYPPGEVNDTFAPEELDRNSDLRWRLGRMWGHLGLVRARRLLMEARELATAGENIP
jgi:hypothetical protein